ncbi:MAG: protein kinase [Polyangiaceae bacterium]|nr:protein kinase [Polyangiaceae bacterium]
MMMAASDRISDQDISTLIQDPRRGDADATLTSQAVPSVFDPLSKAPPRGALIDNVYRVLGPLGKGAMGVIVLARDEKLERDVALKLIRADQTTDAGMAPRLLAEARAMARVHHPNVVEIYAFGEYFGSPYFVMQYVEGTSLDEYVKGRGSVLELDEALSILDQICLGVAAIHASGTVHRDLKPTNILIGSPLRVLVADLGLAQRVSQLEPSDGLSFCGTPAYIAPEIALGHEPVPGLLPRADIYALGIIAYWLLTGQLPFEARSIHELLRLHAYVLPTPPSAVRPSLGTSFDQPLLAALAKDPKNRTASADELRRALARARAEGPPSSKGGSLRILIADDDADFRSLVADILAATLPGAHIEMVADGGAALKAIKERPPSLAVFDIEMPVLNGIELTEAVRALPENPAFPIIVATGTGGPAEWHKLSNLGASAFLVKPFDAIQLITLARGLLGVTSTRSDVLQ